MLKVKDLIAELQKYPADATIMINQRGEFPSSVAPATSEVTHETR